MLFKKFNDLYFWNNIESLIKLREYLRQHRDFQPIIYQDCKALRIDGLGIHEDLAPEVDNSLGDYINSYGGRDEYLATPVFKLSLFAAVVIFTVRMNTRQDCLIPINDMTIERANELVNYLCGREVTADSSVVIAFVRICRRTKNEIDLVLGEYPIELPREESQEVIKFVRKYLYSSVVVSKFIERPLIEI